MWYLIFYTSSITVIIYSSFWKSIILQEVVLRIFFNNLILVCKSIFPHRGSAKNHQRFCMFLFRRTPESKIISEISEAIQSPFKRLRWSAFRKYLTPLTIFTKHSIIVVWQGSKYASGFTVKLRYYSPFIVFIDKRNMVSLN